MSYRRSILIGVALVLFVFVLSALIFYISLGVCPSGTFSCDNGTVCVPQRNMCDNIIDCFDGSDENSNECGQYHGSKEMIFNHHPEKREDVIYSCELTDNSTGCYTMEGNSFLVCKNLGLVDVPNVPSTCPNLLLANNSIVLRNDSFSGLELELIHLEGNNLTDLPTRLFQNQDYVRIMYLSYNRLTSLHSTIFQGIGSIKWLFLDNNQLCDFSLNVFSGLNLLEWLDLSDNNISLEGQAFPNLPAIYEIHLSNNVIPAVDDKMFALLKHLQFLGLKGNILETIHRKAFVGLPNLRELQLSNNKLTYLDPDLFRPLPLLDALFLANNSFFLTAELFIPANLTYLNLDGLELEQINFEVISKLDNLHYIDFKKFYYCSFVPHIKKCRPNTDGVSSLKDLLGKPFLRYMLWIVTALTYLGNGLVMWGRYTFRDEKKTLSMVIRNLAVSDSLMGVYLTVIGVQDARYRDVYHEVSQSWVTSWTCTAAGVVAMVSSEVSMLILTFMSIERFILIAAPFGGHRSFTTQNIVMALFIIWIVGGTLAIMPVIHWRTSTRFYGSYSGTCFPLHIQESYPLGWQYSAFIFLGVNLAGLLLISFVYTALLLSIWHTRRETPLSVVDCEFAIRFFFIVLTDAGCWLPIIALKILALLRFEISADIYGWLVIFVLPLNSAVNPVLYTFTTPRYRDLLMSRGIRAISFKSIRWDYLQRRLSAADTESSRTNTAGSSSKISSLKSDPLKQERKEKKDCMEV